MGRQYELDQFEAGNGQMLLSNAARTFDPKFNANVLPMRRMRFTIRWGSTTYRVFTAFVTKWPPSYPGTGADSVVTVGVVDGFEALNRHKLNTTFAEQRSDLRVAAVLDDMDWPAADRDLRTGQTTIQASTLANVSALQHLQDVIATENGKLYIDGRGYVVFHDRHAPWAVNAQLISQATFGDTGSGSLIVSDTATRANSTSTPGSAETGQAWTVHTGTWGINTEQLYPVTQDDREFMTLESGLVNGYFGVDMYTSSWTAFGLCLTVRGVSTGTYLLVQLLDGMLSLYKYESGIPTLLTAKILTLADSTSYTVLVRASGSSLAISVGGAILIDYTLSAGDTITFTAANATRVGLQQWVYTPGGTVRFDNVLACSATELIYAGISPSYDASHIYNDVRVTREGGTEQTASDATSQATYFNRTLSLSGLLMTADSEAGDCAAFKLAKYKEPGYRFDSIIIKPERNPVLLWPQVLKRDIGDRITVRYTPDTGDRITQDCWIEGISHRFGVGKAWETEWLLSPADVVSYWILGHSVYGILGSTTRLNY